MVIEFEQGVSQYVSERKWHASQVVETIGNGRVRVSLKVAITPELHAWILGFGSSAKIVSPVRLAEEVAVKAMEIANIYSKKAG